MRIHREDGSVWRYSYVLSLEAIRGRSKHSFSAGASSCRRSLTEVAGTGGLSPAGVPVAEVAHRAAVIVVVI